MYEEEKKGSTGLPLMPPAPPVHVLDQGNVWLPVNVKRVQDEAAAIDESVAIRSNYLAIHANASSSSSSASRDKVALALDRGVAQRAQLDVHYPHLSAAVRSLDPDDPVPGVNPAVVVVAVAQALPPQQDVLPPWIRENESASFWGLLSYVCDTRKHKDEKCAFSCFQCHAIVSGELQPFRYRGGRVCVRCLLTELRYSRDYHKILPALVYMEQWCDTYAANSLSRDTGTGRVRGNDPMYVEGAQRLMDKYVHHKEMIPDLWLKVVSYM
jgi:hypothetical protein